MFDTQSLVDKLRPLNPEKIILFGSYAQGKPRLDSDVDILIIQKTQKKPADRVAEVLKQVWGSVPHIEPQVLTPEEFNQALAENRYFLTQEILRFGKVIYEKGH